MVVAGMLVGTGAGRRPAKVNLAEVANEGGRGGLQGRATRRALGAMIVVEVTLAIALVAGAGRLLLSMQQPAGHRSRVHCRRVGWPLTSCCHRTRTPNPNDWQHGRMKPSAPASLRRYLVAMASSLPLRHEWDSTTFVDITSRPTDPANRPNGAAANRQPGLLRGASRSGSLPADRSPRTIAPPVSRSCSSTARGHASSFPDLDPLRERINPSRFVTSGRTKVVTVTPQIIGVVDDVPYSDLTKAAEPTVYVAEAQVPTLGAPSSLPSADGVRSGWSLIFGPSWRSSMRECRSISCRCRARLDVARLAQTRSAAHDYVRYWRVGSGRIGRIRRHRLRFGTTIGRNGRPARAGRDARSHLPHHRDAWRIARRAGSVLGVVLAGWMGGLMGTYLYQSRPATGWFSAGARPRAGCLPQRDDAVSAPGGNHAAGRVLRSYAQPPDAVIQAAWPRSPRARFAVQEPLTADRPC